MIEEKETMYSCDANQYEPGEEGEPILAGKCGGNIKWEVDQIDEAHWFKHGTCDSCGALCEQKG